MVVRNRKARLSFAKPEYMEKYLDITPGSLSILGLMNDREKKVRLLIDADVLKEEWFGCHPCIKYFQLENADAGCGEYIDPGVRS